MRDRLTSWFERLPVYVQVGIVIIGILLVIALALVAAFSLFAYIFLVGAASVTCNNCASNFTPLLILPTLIFLKLTVLLVWLRRPKVRTGL